MTASNFVLRFLNSWRDFLVTDYVHVWRRVCITAPQDIGEIYTIDLTIENKINKENTIELKLES